MVCTEVQKRGANGKYCWQNDNGISGIINSAQRNIRFWMRSAEATTLGQGLGLFLGLHVSHPKPYIALCLIDYPLHSNVTTPKSAII